MPRSENHVDQHEKKNAEDEGTLIKLTQKYSVIDLDEDKFRKFIFNSKKDYYFFVLCDGCIMHCDGCQFLYDEFWVIADSFKNSPFSAFSKVFFGRIDMDKLTNIYHVEIEKSPSVIFFSRYTYKTITNDMILDWDVGETNFRQDICEFIQLKIDVTFTLFQTWTYIMYFINFIKSKYLWANLALIFCSVMVSGFMYNRVAEGTKFLNFNKETNETVYFQDSLCDQYTIESHFVAAIVGLTAVALLMVMDAMSKKGIKKYSLAHCIQLCTIFMGMLSVTWFFFILTAFYIIKSQKFATYFLPDLSNIRNLLSL